MMEKNELRNSIAEKHSNSLHQLKEHFDNIKSQEEAIRCSLQNENLILKGENENVLKEFHTLKTEYELQQEKFNNQLTNLKDKFERELNEVHIKNVSYQSQLQKEFAQRLDAIKGQEKKRLQDITEVTNKDKQNLIDNHLKESDMLANQLNKEFKQQMQRMEIKFHEESKKSHQLHQQV